MTHNNFLRVSVFDEHDACKVRMMRREEFKTAGGISFKAADDITTYVITRASRIGSGDERQHQHYKERSIQ